MKEFFHKANRLAAESSRYLRRHADNQVEWYTWYTWRNEAFERADQEDKPAFRSAGYSACHWCNVRAHESLEDPEVAEILNRYFISAKFDREESPDIEHLYMAFVHALTGRGGQPGFIDRLQSNLDA